MTTNQNSDIASLIASLRRLAAYQHADVSIAEEAADLILQLAYEQETAKAVAEERDACAKKHKAYLAQLDDALRAFTTAVTRARPIPSCEKEEQ